MGCEVEETRIEFYAQGKPLHFQRRGSSRSLVYTKDVSVEKNEARKPKSSLSIKENENGQEKVRIRFYALGYLNKGLFQ